MIPITCPLVGNSHFVTSINNDVLSALTPVKPAALLNRPFILTKIDGLEAVSMFGHSGCITFEKSSKRNGFEHNFIFLKYVAGIDNKMSGQATYFLRSGLLKWDTGLSTSMRSGNAEHIFKQVLTEGAHVSMEDNRLILKSAGHELIFE